MSDSAIMHSLRIPVDLIHVAASTITALEVSAGQL
jgi:hypothetical protein